MILKYAYMETAKALGPDFVFWFQEKISSQQCSGRLRNRISFSQREEVLSLRSYRRAQPGGANKSYRLSCRSHCGICGYDLANQDELGYEQSFKIQYGLSFNVFGLCSSAPIVNNGCNGIQGLDLILRTPHWCSDEDLYKIRISHAR